MMIQRARAGKGYQLPIVLPHALRSGDDLVRGVACACIEHLMWRDNTIREGNLEGPRLHIGWVARVVASAGDIHGDDGAIRSSNYVCIVRAVRKRHMRNTREEDYEPRR